MRIMISYCHNVILSTGSLIDDPDSGSVMVNEYENVNRLLSRSLMANENEIANQLLS